MNNCKTVTVRLSHVIGFCGPGAIVRAPDEYIVPRDTNSWIKDGRPAGIELTNVCQVRAVLGINERLYAPPVASLKKEGKREIIKGFGIRTVRFPAWARCEKCGKLYQYPWSRQKTDTPVCLEKKCKRKKLVQVPWVLIHPHGYMDDLPWPWLAHMDTRIKCEDRENIYVNFQHKIKISCKTCNAHFYFTPQALAKIPFKAMKKQPWLDWKDNQVPREELEACPAIAMEIGDSRIYQSNTKNALVIPPESRKTNSLAAKLNSMPELLNKLRAVPRRLRKGRFKTYARNLQCSVSELESALREVENGCEEYEEITPEKLKEKEYEAFLTEIQDFQDGEQFITRHRTREWKELPKESLENHLKKIVNIVDTLIAVERLREIRVFKGFSRSPVEDKEGLVPPDLAGKQDWLPALELWGEGIFFSINEEYISQWEQNPEIMRRLAIIIDNLDKPCEILSAIHSSLPNKEELPRFILLHTLSHLIIRQLEYLAGYPAASLKERIYCNIPGSQGCTMAGILIYVAVPDKAGSLGGLYEQAEPQRFLALMDEVFKHAEWCSLDPVCSEHRGQGPCGLNLAACHACLHIPDTACCYSNVLLDRMLIAGIPETGNEKGFDAFLNMEMPER